MILHEHDLISNGTFLLDQNLSVSAPTRLERLPPYSRSHQRNMTLVQGILPHVSQVPTHSLTAKAPSMLHLSRKVINAQDPQPKTLKQKLAVLH